MPIGYRTKETRAVFVMNFENHKRTGETPAQARLPDTDWKEVPRPSGAPERDSAPEPQVAESQGPRVAPKQLLLW